MSPSPCRRYRSGRERVRRRVRNDLYSFLSGQTSNKPLQNFYAMTSAAVRPIGYGEDRLYHIQAARRTPSGATAQTRQTGRPFPAAPRPTRRFPRSCTAARRRDTVAGASARPAPAGYRPPVTDPTGTRDSGDPPCGALARRPIPSTRRLCLSRFQSLIDDQNPEHDKQPSGQTPHSSKKHLPRFQMLQGRPHYDELPRGRSGKAIAVGRIVRTHSASCGRPTKHAVPCCTANHSVNTRCAYEQECHRS